MYIYEKIKHINLKVSSGVVPFYFCAFFIKIFLLYLSKQKHYMEKDFIYITILIERFRVVVHLVCRFFFIVFFIYRYGKRSSNFVLYI